MGFPRQESWPLILSSNASRSVAALSLCKCVLVVPYGAWGRNPEESSFCTSTWTSPPGRLPCSPWLTRARYLHSPSRALLMVFTALLILGNVLTYFTCLSSTCPLPHIKTFSVSFIFPVYSGGSASRFMLFSSLVAQTVKRLSTMQETRVQSLGWEDPLEKEMAIHSSTLAWKIPWMEEPGRL